MAILERWSSYKKPVSRDHEPKFGRSWQFLVFSSAMNVLKKIKFCLDKDLQFCVFWSHSRKLKMFSVTFDFECTYIKEVQYNCSAHVSVHLFIIAISSHSHKERKEPQFFFNVTMINIKKCLRRKIHELKTLIGTSDDS